MDCQKVVNAYNDLFSRIKRLKPLKDDTIFIKVENCLIKITRKDKQLTINSARSNDIKGQMIIKFADFSTLQNVLNATDLKDYGERLLYAVLDRKVLLDPGNVEKAMQSGFYKLISRNRVKKHILIFELTIPVV